MFSWAERHEGAKKRSMRMLRFAEAPLIERARQWLGGLRAWAQFLLDLVFFEDDVVRQAVFSRGFRFADDQRGRVLNELIVWQESILGDPVAWNEMFDIGDVLEGFESDGPFVGVRARSDDLWHEATLAIRGGARGSDTAGVGFLGIDLAGEMTSGTLCIAEKHGAALKLEAILDKILKNLGSSG